MFLFAGNFEIHIVSNSLEIEQTTEAVLVKSNVDLLSPEFTLNPINLVLREMAQNENFAGFNQIIDAEQNVIDASQMDDNDLEARYGVGNLESDDVNGYFTFEKKITPELAEGLMTVRPHVIEVTV